MSSVPDAPSSTNGRLSCSVVVCTYSLDRWGILTESVGSVLRQATPAEVEVVVVIDHNEELLARARHEFPGCTVVANDGPQGLSAARNTGVRVARGAVVLFLDDDATVADGWLASHHDAYLDATVIGTAGLVVPRWEAGAPPSWWPHEFDWVVGCTYIGAPTERVAVRNPIGANMGFRRAAILDAGGFSADLGRVGTVPVGCEETELSIRIAVTHPGTHVLSLPDAACHHLVPATRASWSYFWRRCLAEGRSKAVVATFAGAGAATAAERTYATRTLPRGVGRALRRGQLRKAAAVIAGLSATAAGFATHTVRLKARRPARGDAPAVEQ